MAEGVVATVVVALTAGVGVVGLATAPVGMAAMASTARAESVRELAHDAMEKCAMRRLLTCGLGACISPVNCLLKRRELLGSPK